jgi:lipopolysaccharide transport system ATP-binding protein
MVLPRLQNLLGLKSKKYFKAFQAINEISFQIKGGETVGLIGTNGSGKSTILQILCGTLTASSGEIKVMGRVAALLELGAGFNPEFTGRENVYMNARIMGLSKEIIDERFESIVEFADIGDFIDRPVKIYSSGMFVRLAFAVIAHVDADILVIDEALAVGDAIFTQKCMRYLRGFMKLGTVFFVSHDMSSIKNLCTRVMWIEKGNLLQDGDPKEVCDLYYQHTLQSTYGSDHKLNSLTRTNNSISAEELGKVAKQEKPRDCKSKISVVDNFKSATGWKTESAEIISISIENLDNTINSIFEGGDRVRVNIHAKMYAVLNSPILGFIVKDRLGQELFGENTLPFTVGKDFSVLPGQEIEADFIFKMPMLQNGQYVVMSSLADGDSYKHVHHHYIHDALIFNVYSDRIRFGIVDIAFESISLEIDKGK